LAVELLDEVLTSAESSCKAKGHSGEDLGGKESSDHD